MASEGVAGGAEGVACMVAAAFSVSLQDLHMVDNALRSISCRGRGVALRGGGGGALRCSCMHTSHSPSPSHDT